MKSSQYTDVSVPVTVQSEWSMAAARRLYNLNVFAKDVASWLYPRI